MRWKISMLASAILAPTTMWSSSRARHLHDRRRPGPGAQTGAGYIGMIGSRARSCTVRLESGCEHPADLDRVCPIGLTIGGHA